MCDPDEEAQRVPQGGREVALYLAKSLAQAGIIPVSIIWIMVSAFSDAPDEGRCLRMAPLAKWLRQGLDAERSVVVLVHDLRPGLPLQQALDP